MNKIKKRKELEENAQQKYYSDKSGQQHWWLDYYLYWKKISVGKNNRGRIICCMGKSEENCDEGQINEGLAGLVKIC